MSRALSPRTHWIAWGALAGVVYGMGYGWFGWRLVGEGPWLAPVMGSACIGAAIGVAFAARYREARPTETNLCTWLGILLGVVPALECFFLFLMAGSARSKLSIYGLAAFAFMPIAAGLLVGALLDRLSEGILFRGPAEGEQPVQPGDTADPPSAGR